jgi:diguanylate cyclase (GGDEF)-like protein
MVQRDRVMYGLAFLGAVFLLPFAVNNFVKGRPGLGLAIVVVVLTLALDGLAIHLKRPPPVPYALLVVPMAAAITLSLSAQGVIGAFWCYPAVVFLFFVLPRRAAIVANGGLLLAASVQVYRYLGLSTAVRFTVSLVLTIVVVTIIQNVIRELQQRLLDQAITDPLTGAFNRRYMAERLAEAIERQRRSGAPASVLIIDLDHFKRVNDDLGHEAGDAVLKGIVALLGRRSRRVDLLFRMGGEEFLLLLPDTAEEQAAKLAEDLRASIEDYPLLADRRVTVSIGVGELQAGETLDTWLQQADAALYSAKQSGRNRVARRRPAETPADGDLAAGRPQAS